MKTKAINLIAIAIGAAIMGFGINYFNIANNLGEGGLTGLSILLKLAFDLDPGMTTLLMNIPLFIVGWKVLGRDSLAYTIYGTVCLSLALSLFGSFRFPTNDTLLAALFAGVTVGVGLGIIFRYGGTTGGVDIIARIFHKYLGWKVGRTMLVADVLVIGISLTYLTPQQAMYTLVAVFVGTRIIDFVQEAAYSARAAWIVSDASETIAKRVVDEMDRGATLLRGEGAFTRKARTVVYVVVARSEIVKLKAIVHGVDPHAFISIGEANEVMGEGFTLEKTRRVLAVGQRA